MPRGAEAGRHIPQIVQQPQSEQDRGTLGDPRFLFGKDPIDKDHTGRFPITGDEGRDVLREVKDELSTEKLLLPDEQRIPEHGPISERNPLPENTPDGATLLENAALAELDPRYAEAINKLRAQRGETPLVDRIFQPVDDNDIIDEETILTEKDNIAPPPIPENAPYLLTEKDISPGPEIPEDIHDLTESDLEEIEDMSGQEYPQDLKQYAEALDILDQMDLSPNSTREADDIIQLPKEAALAPPSPPKAPQKSSKLGRWIRNATLAIGGLFVGSRSVEHIDTATPSSKAEIASTTQTEINNVNPSFETRQQNSTDIQKKAENSKKSSSEILAPKTKEERLRESMQESTKGIDSKLASYPVIYFDTDPKNKNIEKYVDQRTDDHISYRDKKNNTIYTVSPEKIHLTTFDNEGRFSKILIAHTDHKKKDFNAFQDMKAVLADKTIQYEYTSTGELSSVIVSNGSSHKSLTTQDELRPYFMLTKAAPTIHVSEADPHVKERIDAAFEGTAQ
jgi:hypothetical protein